MKRHVEKKSGELFRLLREKSERGQKAAARREIGWIEVSKNESTNKRSRGGDMGIFCQRKGNPKSAGGTGQKEGK